MRIVKQEGNYEGAKTLISLIFSIEKQLSENSAHAWVKSNPSKSYEILSKHCFYCLQAMRMIELVWRTWRSVSEKKNSSSAPKTENTSGNVSRSRRSWSSSRSSSRRIKRRWASRGTVAQLIAGSNKGPWLVQLDWRGIKSWPRDKVVGKYPSSAICEASADISPLLGNYS